MSIISILQTSVGASDGFGSSNIGGSIRNQYEFANVEELEYYPEFEDNLQSKGDTFNPVLSKGNPFCLIIRLLQFGKGNSDLVLSVGNCEYIFLVDIAKHGTCCGIS